MDLFLPLDHLQLSSTSSGESLDLVDATLHLSSVQEDIPHGGVEFPSKTDDVAPLFDVSSRVVDWEFEVVTLSALLKARHFQSQQALQREWTPKISTAR